MKTIILVGAGDVHLHILREWKQEPLANCRLVLIHPFRDLYPLRMYPGYVEGWYNPRELRIPLIPYCRITRTESIEDTIVGVDPQEKTLFGSKGISYAYDIVSFDLQPSQLMLEKSGHQNNLRESPTPGYFVLKDSELADQNGVVPVTPHLQSLTSEFLFVVGEGSVYENNSSYQSELAIKQGAVLWYNIQSIILGRPLKAFHPTRKSLSFTYFGNGDIRAHYGKISCTGRLAAWLKRSKDRSFMKRYR